MKYSNVVVKKDNEKNTPIGSEAHETPKQSMRTQKNPYPSAKM